MYSTYELSNSSGYPVELFEFSSSDVYYRYAYHDDEVVTAYTWTPQLISRNNFTKGVEIDRSGVTLTVSPSLPVLSLFEDGIPEQALNLTIYRTHLTDPDQELWTIWSGEVVSLKRVGRKIELACEPPEVSLKSSGLRRRYQSSCPYPVYGIGCNIDKLNFAVTHLVTSVFGTTIKLDLADTSHFIGGMLVYLKDGQQTYRKIVDASEDWVVASRPVSGLLVGAEVTVYRGCDKTFSTCSSVFGNGANYGGFKDMPTSNIFNTKVF